MAKRKKGEDSPTLLTSAGPVQTPAPVTPPPVVEYQPAAAASPWRVERWEAFCAELDLELKPEQLPVVDAALRPHARSWLVARRLFGFIPVKLSLSANPDDYRTVNPAELCDQLGITRPQLQEELKALAAVVRRALGVDGAGGSGEESFVSPGTIEGRSELLVDDDKILSQFGYPRRMFEVVVRNPVPGQEPIVRRPAAENSEERGWFAGRVRQFEKLLLDPMVGRLADQLLRNELRLRRIENEMAILVVGSKEEKELTTSKDALEKIIERQLESLKEMAPWFNTTEKRVQARDAFSEIIRGMQEYRARGDTALIDGIYTAYELQVLMRTSVQKPMPDYRFGLNLLILESRQGLFDPEWRSRLRQRDLQKWDAGFQEGMKRYIEETGQPVPDLLNDGAEGEFENIFVPEEEEVKAEG